MSSSRVRVYMGCSFDGFIAGPDHDISWLDESYSAAGDLQPDSDVLTFERFMSEVGAMLMGRRMFSHRSERSSIRNRLCRTITASRSSDILRMPTLSTRPDCF